MTGNAAPQAPEPPRAVLRARRALLAGAMVGGGTLCVVLAVVVAVRLLSEWLGYALLGGIVLFGVGVGVTTAVFDWFLE